MTDHDSHQGDDTMNEQNERPELNARAFTAAKEEAKNRFGRFNLAIVGGTGVGKSSLVNAVFGRDVAKVGKGLPVTRGAHYYHDDVLGIWDLEGFEMGEKTPLQLLDEHLAAIAARAELEQISVVWYCVNAETHRLQPAEIDVLRELERAGLPVILVLTKVDWAKHPVTGRRTLHPDMQQFCDWLEHPVDHDDQPISVPFDRYLLTSTREKAGKPVTHGLGELVEETLALAPESEKDAFRIAQRLNLPWKRELARPVIVGASAAAAGAAAVPIPVADAVALAPIQLGMMGRIATIYDLEFTTMLSATAIAQMTAKFVGQALARSVVKVIPGAGSFVNAGVAAALTAATGEAWMRLCEQVYTGKIDLSKVQDSWLQYAPGLVDVVRKMLEQRSAKA